MGGMGDPLGEVGIGPGMAFSAGLEQPGVRDEGFGIVRRKDIMKPVAIGAACHKARISQFLNLSMVALVIGLGGDRERRCSVPSSPCRHDTSGRPPYETPSEMRPSWVHPPSRGEPYGGHGNHCRPQNPDCRRGRLCRGRSRSNHHRNGRSMQISMTRTLSPFQGVSS